MSDAPGSRPGRWQVAEAARCAPAATVLLTCCALVAQASTLLLPLLSARVVDRVLTAQTAGSLLAALAGLLVLRAAAEAGLVVGQATVASRVGLSMRVRLLRHCFAVGLPVLRRFPTGDLVTRLTGNAAVAARTLPALVGAAVAMLASLVGLVALWVVDWRVGAAFVLAVVPAVVLLRRVMGGASTAFGDYLERLREITVRLADAVTGSRTIHACGTTAREVDRILRPLPELARAGRRTWALQRRVSWQLDLAVTAVRVVVLATAGLGLAAGRLSPGQVVAVSLLVTVALGFLYQADTLLHLADTRANATRVRDVLDLPGGAPASPPPDPPTGRGGAGRGYAAGTLSLRGVSVHLDGHPVLRGVDLDVPAGSAVALVGRSGAGKSTLALLVGGLLRPDTGTVLLDGAPVGRAGAVPTGARQDVSYAFDRPVLLGRSIRDALGYGRPALPTSVVTDALRLAHAEEFVRRLPAGLDTELSDAPFSGGELQRLGLARAVLHTARVLVLDDATSSLDTVTEARVTQALTERLAGRTRLVIAHRAGTAARADLVAWLDDGRIRAVARHDRLWASEPDYRAVFGDQSGTDVGATTAKAQR